MSHDAPESCHHGEQMLLAALFIYFAIAALAVFALAVAAASGNKSDRSLQRDAEIVELALSKPEDARRAS